MFDCPNASYNIPLMQVDYNQLAILFVLLVVGCWYKLETQV